MNYGKKKTVNQNRIYTPDESFISYKELCNTLFLETPIVFPDGVDVLKQEIPCVRVPVVPIVYKHKRKGFFLALVNCLVYLNPEISLHQLQSYVNFWNIHMTDYAMSTREMKQLVHEEHQRLLQGGKNRAYVTVKSVHTRPGVEDRRKLANIAKGEMQKDEAMYKIQCAIDVLNAINEKVSVKAIVEKLKGTVSIHTVRRYYGRLRVKEAALPTENLQSQQNISEMNELIPVEAPNEPYKQPVNITNHPYAKPYQKTTNAVYEKKWALCREKFKAERNAEKIALNNITK